MINCVAQSLDSVSYGCKAAGLDRGHTYICDSTHSLIVDDGVLLHFLRTLVKDLSNKDLDLGVLGGFE